MTLPMGKELENQLVEAGNRLLNPPSSAEELVTLLDQVETYLTRVEQSPLESMETALVPLKKALVASDLLMHADMDVKVGAACCISEITRISAPNSPYGDDEMKDIFQLIVSTFENLFDMSSSSYSKRVSILETVAKVRSCVVMLDLECDGLILEMFEHFLKAIRDNHPDNVFSSMETIMALVLEESEDIAPGLISLLLICARKENEDVSPIARKLVEKVLENCAAKLKPYLMQAVSSLGASMNDYSKIVASICQEISVTVDLNNVNASEEHMADGDKLLEKTSFDKSPQVTEEMIPKTTSREHDHGVDMSQMPLMSNVSAENGDDILRKSPDSSMNKLEQSQCAPLPTKAELDNSVTKIVTSETNLDQPAKKSRSKTNSINTVDALKNSRVELPNQRKARCEKANNTISEDQLGNEASIGHEKGTGPVSSLTASQSEVVASAFTGQSLPDEIPAKRARKPKNGNVKQGSHSGSSVEGALSSNQVGGELRPSADVISKEQPKGKCDSEAKLHTQSDKKEGTRNNKYNTPPSMKDTSEKKSGKVIALKDNPLKKSGQKSASEDGLPVDKDESKTKKAGVKTIMKKGITGDSSDKKKVSSLDSLRKTSNKDRSRLEETPKSNSKRKLTSETNETSSMRDISEDLKESVVGSKIKVWWPLDHRFYSGTIHSFDPVKKTHKVIYDDGDVEILNLRMERWKLVGIDPTLDEALASDLPSPGAIEMPQEKKVKTDSDSSSKQSKPSASLRRGRGSSTGKGKSRSAAPRYGGNSKRDVNVGGKTNDDSTKISGKTKDESVGKSENVRPKTEAAQKSITKLKDDTPKSGIKSKDETSVSGSKFSANDPNFKGKYSALKVQGIEKLVIGKALDSLKAVESETKVGKKRQRALNV